MSFVAPALLPNRVRCFSFSQSVTNLFAFNHVRLTPTLLPLRTKSTSPSFPKGNALQPNVSMRVALDGDTVLVHYTGYLEDGTIFDSSLKRNEPLSFTIGGGDVITGFDDTIRGLAPGESTRASIAPDRAYGHSSDEFIFTITKEMYPPEMPLEVGKRVPLANGMSATVIDIVDDKVKLDANHQLAGKTLTFEMEFVGFAEVVLSPPADRLHRAVFGLGCFWGTFLRPQYIRTTCASTLGKKFKSNQTP